MDNNLKYYKRLEEALERYFGDEIINYLKRDEEIIEIMANPDNSLFIEKMGQPMQRVGTVKPQNIRAIINTLASYHDMVIDQEQTILECEVPFCGSRFLGKIPPSVSSPSFTIRKKATKIFTLSDYLKEGIITKNQKVIIEESIKSKKNILIVGGTGSGKTTLTNAIIETISTLTPNDRILIIEDTAEIQCSAQNKVISRTTKKVSMQDLVKSSLRERPDRVLIGEIRGKEALDLITIWNTGHPGGVATVHANSAYEALKRLERLLALANAHNMQEEIAQAINTVIFIKKTPNGRVVDEILEIQHYDREKHEYITKTRL
ncbi:MAG TPA: P-type conjugative transfer ATPase TrbB [Campylobacterales bacterium]|nr:P-type conjugative transfer ATPase TrbB [Campylobacterales bacterium]